MAVRTVGDAPLLVGEVSGVSELRQPDTPVVVVAIYADTGVEFDRAAL